MVRKHNLAYSQERLEQICRKYNVARLSLFGSAVRDDFDAESDVDVLVEFIDGRTPGLHIVDMRDELVELFGRDVDLVTPRGVSRYFREQVLAIARPIYDAA